MRRVMVLAFLGLLLATGWTPAVWTGPDPSDPRNFTWVVPGVLAIGGGHIDRKQVEFLKEHGFEAVANFRAERPDDAGAIHAADMEHVYLPVAHAVDLNVTQLREFVAWAKSMEREGRTMYVHCTNGWHRAAAFVVAWEMERTGKSFDELAKNATQRRPGTVMRAPSSLLAYEAELRREDALVVMLQSPLARPEPNGTMPVTVEVLGRGEPVPGANVHVWSEASRLQIRGVTDATGRFTFEYRAPPSSAMDHLYARASHKDFRDGADDVELFYMLPVREGRALEIRTTYVDGGIGVTVLRNGHPAHAHVLATTADGWTAFDTTGTGHTTIPLPEENEPIRVRAESWGSIGDRITLHPPRARGEVGQAYEGRAPIWVDLDPAPGTRTNAEEAPTPTAKHPTFAALALGLALLGAGTLAYAHARRSRRRGRAPGGS